MQPRPVWLGIVLSLFACVPASMLKSQFDPAVPQIGYLQARVDALYQAEQANDWRTWYLMTSPELRKELSYEEFTKEAPSRSFEMISWRIRSITRLEDPSLPTGVTGARVGMDVRIERRGGPMERDTDQTDYWLYIDGEWYWSWRGWPDD